VVAYLLAGLEVPVWVTGFSGGIVGKLAEEILRAQGVRIDFVEVKGTARINVVLNDLSGGWQGTITAPGVKVKSDHERHLISLVHKRLEESSCLVLGGSLPQGCSADLYKKLITMAIRSGVPCILDTSGPVLREAIKACPTAIKPNRDEAAELLNQKISSVDDALCMAKMIHRKGIKWVVITLGKQGLVAFGDGKGWYAPPPPLIPKTTAGAGDAVVAGLALGLSKSWGIEDSLRWGVAAAAALMEKETVLECELWRVDEWLRKISVQPLKK